MKLTCSICNTPKVIHFFQRAQYTRIQRGLAGRCRECMKKNRPVPPGLTGWKDPDHRDRWLRGNNWTVQP